MYVLDCESYSKLDYMLDFLDKWSFPSWLFDVLVFLF